MNQEFFESPFWKQFNLMAQEDYFRLANRLINNTDANFTMYEYAYLRGALDKLKELMMLEEKFISETDHQRKTEKQNIIKGKFWGTLKGVFRRTMYQ